MNWIWSRQNKRGSVGSCSHPDKIPISSQADSCRLWSKEIDGLDVGDVTDDVDRACR